MTKARFSIGDVVWLNFTKLTGTSSIFSLIFDYWEDVIKKWKIVEIFIEKYKWVVLAEAYVICIEHRYFLFDYNTTNDIVFDSREDHQTYSLRDSVLTIIKKNEEKELFIYRLKRKIFVYIKTKGIFKFKPYKSPRVKMNTDLDNLDLKDVNISWEETKFEWWGFVEIEK